MATAPDSHEVDSIEEAVAEVVSFREARNWGQYHRPEHLSRALSIEASELEEEFLWLGPTEVEKRLQSDQKREAVKDEIGDVLIYALLFCEQVGIDPLNAIGDKLEKNREKFPVEEVRGQPTIEDASSARGDTSEDSTSTGDVP
jgi:NTP pyrophosphatase (non-canonical NTP hydrolase)